MLSSPVTLVIGQSGDARMELWKSEAKWMRRGRGRREGKIDADERNGSDRFWREVEREGWRDGSEGRNIGSEPSRCSQHVCLFRCRFSASARGMTQLLPCKLNDSDPAKQSRTEQFLNVSLLSHSYLL